MSDDPRLADLFSSIDEVLAGNEQQRSSEQEQSAPVPPGCCRCGDDDLDPDSGLCPHCRAFLLGDSDLDPAAEPASDMHIVMLDDPESDLPSLVDMFQLDLPPSATPDEETDPGVRVVLVTGNGDGVLHGTMADVPSSVLHESVGAFLQIARSGSRTYSD